MAIRLEVTCETQAGDVLCISGDDPSLGAWDEAKVVQLETKESQFPMWSKEIPIPSGGSEFKLLVLKSGGEIVWEPLENRRKWPTTAMGAGTIFRTKYGETKVGVEVGKETIEAHARSSRDLEKRRGSALQEDLDRRGDNAYYYAHSRKFEVPEDAKVISGPGLITGGAPVLLEMGTETIEDSDRDRTMWLKDYSWVDSGAKVKVYVPLAEGVLPAEGADSIVEASYNVSNLDVTIMARPKQRLKIEKLNADIKPESCTTRVEAKKNRIVLQLAKKRDTITWYNLTKSK